jgi:hypothetical protein
MSKMAIIYRHAHIDEHVPAQRVLQKCGQEFPCMEESVALVEMIFAAVPGHLKLWTRS